MTRVRQEPWHKVLTEKADDVGKTNGNLRRTTNPDDTADPDESTPEPVTAPSNGGLDRVVDVDYRGRKYVVEEAPMLPGDDGDDNPEALNPAGEMAAAGHGFLIDDQSTPPWKTPHRTHCAHCGGEMPPPDVRGDKYRCEFSPYFDRCTCSGCTLRKWVLSGVERNVGHPAKCCSDDCKRARKNERDRWARAVKRAVERGDEPPPEPEDRGLKHLRASIP